MAESVPTAVDKAFSVLRTIAEHEESTFGVSQLARVAGLPKSTTFRMLQVLLRNGAVVRDGTHYRLGPLFMPELVLPATEEANRVHLALTPALAVLFQRSRQTVQLAMLHDGRVVFLNKLHGDHRAPSPSRIGGHAPAHCTSLGKALLAFDPDAAALVVARGLERWTPNTITDPDELAAALSKIRRSRVALDDEEYLPDVASVSSPVFGPDGRAVAALCITWPRSEGLHAEYRRLVLDVAARSAHRYARFVS